MKPATSITSRAEPGRPPQTWQAVCVCLLLVAVVWVVYGQTGRFDFVNYDDNKNVYDNLVVAQGLSGPAVVWAFTHPQLANWIPLTTLSHMLDCQLFGLHAGGHHLVNVLLHAVNAVLLFLVLGRMTGRLWRSAFVAAVFAVHPLHVESVAWISERKDVLSGMFFLLTLGAYGKWALGSGLWALGKKEAQKTEGGRQETGAVQGPKPRPQTSDPRPIFYYWAAVGLFALGLMAKPMLVTLPMVLLVLDYWPLRRFEPGRGLIPWRLVREKIPLLALSAVACVITLHTQAEARNPDRSPVQCLSNALDSYAVYVKQMFWPVRLAVHYPYPKAGWPPGELMAAGLGLAAVSAAVWAARRKQPWLPAGWLWYLGMLVPVIGLVPVGEQAHSDRYTYLPQIGLYIMLTWLLAERAGRRRDRRWALGGPALVALAALAVCARVQTTYWRDGEAFWAHALDCTRDNDVAEDNLGAVLLQRGQTDAALVHVQRALAIQPNNAGAHINLGDILVGKGQIDEALTEYQTAVGLEPGLYEAHDDLGIALFKKGQVDAAIGQYQAAIALDPDQAGAHNNLSRARLQKRDLDGAMTQAREALKLRPDLADAHRNLGVALVQAGRLDEGIEQLRQALAIQPGLVEAQTALTQIAWIEATSPDPTVRNGIRAMQLAEQTDRLGGGTNAMQAATLAAAYAEAGRFPEAVTAARRAVELAGSLTNAAGAAMTADFTAQLQSYQAGRPYRVGQSKN